MSLLMMDSLDHYGTLDGGGKWTTHDFGDAGTRPPSFISYGTNGNPVLGRRGSAGLTHDRSGNDTAQGITPSGGEWVQVGLAYFTDFATDDDVIKIADAATSGVYQCVLKRLPNGALRVRNGSNDTFGTTLGDTRARLFHRGQFAYIEFRVRKHATLGEAHVYVNGRKELALTSVDTIGTGPSGNVGRIEFRADGGMDDYYICDSGGTVPELDASNDATPGDVYIEMLIAQTGDGFHTDFTPTSGVDHGAMVDDGLTPTPEPTDCRSRHPDDDVDAETLTANESLTVGDKDSYNHANVGEPTHTQIFAVQYNPWVAKDDVGTVFLRAFTRISGTDYNDAFGSYAMSQAWQDNFAVWQRSPATAAAWTIAELDGAEFGVEVTAS